MLLIEAAIRGGVIALILVLGALALSEARRSVASRYSVLFALCGIAYLIESAPSLAQRRDLWICAVRLVSVATPAVFWVWVKAQIDDPFIPSWRHWLPWLGMVGLGAWAMIVDRWLPWRIVQVAALVLVGLGIWQTLAGRGGDLVEGRRRLRLVLAFGAALYIVALEIVAFLTLGRNGIVTVIATNLALGAYVAFGIAVRVVHKPAVSVAEVPLSIARQTLPAAPDAEEPRLFERLQQAMEVDKAYREEDCSIAVLAARLGIPEYRLRRLINQRLGHRNFTTYINSYRLAETTAALADPSQARVPILTIALDAGFQSLGPFNRAFKAHTGKTPSEFRREHLGEPSPAPRASMPPAAASPIPKSASA
jgi:AraC-like DNA-binding protein